MKTIITILYLMMTSWGLSAQWIPTYGPPGGTPIDALGTDGTKIFAGTAAGIFISYDNGNSWHDANADLGQKYVNCFVFKDSFV